MSLRKPGRETDHEILAHINTFSPSFCLAKWYNATIWLGSGMTTSCHHPLPHKIDEQVIHFNPKALHNTAQKKSERAMMQRGEKPSGCEYCWKIEGMERNAISDRVYKTVIYDDKDLANAYNLPSEQDVDLQTLEIAFDRTCQFACSYCNPAFSSTWVNDIRKNGPYNNLVSDGRNHFTHTHDSSQLYKFGEANPYVEAFFKWWDTDLHKTLKELRITGGEPLMSGYTWKLIDWFKTNQGKSQTKLAINSNLGFDRELVDKFVDTIKGLPHVEIYTSQESIGAQAEYIRDGLNYPQWLENVRFLIESNAVKAVHVMCTINALCLDSLPNLLDTFLTIKQENNNRDAINYTLNILRFPSFQSALVLPDDIRTKYRDNLQIWYDTNKDSKYLHQHELNHLRRLIDYLDVVKTPHREAFDSPKLLNDFKQFYKQYDQRRGKDFALAFPNLTAWYNSL